MAGMRISPSLDRLLDPTAWAVLDLLPAQVAVLDREFRILRSNQTFRRDLGEGDGRRCYEVYKKGGTVCPECGLGRVFEEARSVSWEESLQTTPGARMHTIVHAVPIRDGEGRVAAALKVSSDISETKQMQRQLELSQQEYKALFQGVPCYISIQDRDYRIIRTNRFFERDFGKGLGKKCFEVYKGRSAKCEPCPVEKTFEDGQVHFSEETVRMTTGEPVDMVVYTAPIQDHLGQTFAVMEMSTNIAEVKRLQRELATLGQAVAITAHTIKNILNGLEGGAYVVQSGLRRGDQGLAQKGWEMVREGVDMVGHLVKDILLISRARTPEYRDTAPEEVAKQVWTLFEKRAKDLEIDLILDPDGLDNGTRVSVDPKGVHTVLSNLVANALDACVSDPDRREHWVRIGVKDMGTDGILYEVEDNGPGISHDLQDKLFREMVSTKGSRGTGLGLVVTQKIVTEHGGTISHQAAPSKGTVFRVRFPRSGSPALVTEGDGREPDPRAQASAV
jgi:signal transduction histidine kinase